jgi:O-antigen/teichoic acid export membrane protein
LKLKNYSKFIENFVSFSAYKAIDALIPLIIIPYLINVVGSEKYGIYAFGFALIFYLINIVQYGFSLSAVRLISLNRENKTKLNSIYSQVFTTQLYLTFTVLFVLSLLVSLVDKFSEYYVIYLFFYILIIGELLTPMWLFLGIEKMRFITIVNLISKSTFAILTFLLVNKESDFIYISLYQSIGFLISGLTAQYIVFVKLRIKFSLVSFYQVKIMLKDGVSSFLTLITPTIYTNTSIFLIGVFGVPQFVSYMQIGTKVSGAFSVLNTILTNVFYPIINRNNNLFKRVKYIFIFFGSLLSLIMYFCSEFLISIWIPEDSTEIIRVVKYLSPTPFLASVISIYGVNGLLVQNKDKLYMIIVAIGSISGFLMGLLLIPKYYYIGGAITVVFALSIKAILSFVYNKKTTNQLKQENEV